MGHPRGKRLPKDAASSSTPSRSTSGPSSRRAQGSRDLGKATWRSASASAVLTWSSGPADRWCWSPARRLAGQPGPAGADHGHGPAPRAAGSLVDLGPRQGDGRARPAHRCPRGPVFLCDPRSPWQRASNQNANGLVRQDLPRTADLRRFSQADLDRIAAELNDRPRQIHGFQTPSHVPAEALRRSPETALGFGQLPASTKPGTDQAKCGTSTPR